MPGALDGGVEFGGRCDVNAGDFFARGGVGADEFAGGGCGGHDCPEGLEFRRSLWRRRAKFNKHVVADFGDEIIDKNTPVTKRAASPHSRGFQLETGTLPAP
ncbi:hypothetical protein SDC9_131547 [bioreactor metagenome]|uniref:Uncharacterized protein n=1 Tax=bioreactor metagenome TaxID=1076179 RepID=A0A645D5I4_9ZZZZ